MKVKIFTAMLVVSTTFALSACQEVAINSGVERLAVVEQGVFEPEPRLVVTEENELQVAYRASLQGSEMPVPDFMR